MPRSVKKKNKKLPTANPKNKKKSTNKKGESKNKIQIRKRDIICYNQGVLNGRKSLLGRSEFL